MVFVSFFDCLEDLLLCLINFSHLSLKGPRSLWDPIFSILNGDVNLNCDKRGY